MTGAVYKPSAKGIADANLHESDRFLFLGDGTVAHYRNGVLLQADMLWRTDEPDGDFCVRTDEPLPSQLEVSEREYQHIKRHHIELPFTLVVMHHR